MNEQSATDHEQYRTHLAEEQTRLARERTTLSHIRTGFASFLFGVAIFGLFGDLISTLAGGFFIAVGLLFLVTGWVSYVRSNRRTRELIEELEHPFRRL
ncbi:DUF202 domain-containing protein [Salinirubrum litoreum]|uniref:DUF202 domain-containing protein n=1 Tax=Salinirubrum litoreum TaxID=1126234 RepID=A0ABD5RFF2_9EURY|nr:DUF202 domain-containing protein [Salinirubrum litoreum]